MRGIITILLMAVLGSVSGNTIVVEKNLKQAIQHAKDGDTVLLKKGIYKEGNIIITKSICLIGIDAPVLDGDHKNEILTISGKNITIKGIHFLNAGHTGCSARWYFGEW